MISPSELYHVRRKRQTEGDTSDSPEHRGQSARFEHPPKRGETKESDEANGVQNPNMVGKSAMSDTLSTPFCLQSDHEHLLTLNTTLQEQTGRAESADCLYQQAGHVCVRLESRVEGT